MADRVQADFGRARRDRATWMVVSLLGVAVAAGALALGWGVIQGRLTAAKQLDRAVALFEGTEATVSAADAVVRAGLGPETAVQVSAVAPLVEAARAQLAEASTSAEAGFDRLTDDEQRHARLLQQAAAARGDMLGSAAAALLAAQRAATAKELVTQAWTKTLAADELALRSVEDYNAATTVSVERSVVASRRAKQGFTVARSIFNRADRVFPEAKLGVFVTYVDARLALVKLSERADGEWLAGRIVQANRLRASYNETNEAAVKAARKLPGSPVTTVSETYEALANLPSSAYYKARQRAAEADAALAGL